MRQHVTPERNPCADLDALRDKAETFFEWPDDAGEKPRDYVTFTSCLLFARDCVNDWQAKHQDILATFETIAAENIRLRQAIEKTIADNLHLADGEVCTLIDLKRAVNWDDRAWPETALPWQPVDTAPIDTPLLATYLDAAGKPKVIRAELIGRLTQPTGPDWETCPDYDEATDTYYRAAGWIELVDHWDDHDGCYIHATIIGWMPLPEPMEAPA